jgi:type I restriction modification DNA specificity protein
MAQINIVKYSEIEESHRLDSEFFKKEYLDKINELKKLSFGCLLNSFITDGEHGSPEWDDKSNIKYITAEKIKDSYIEGGYFSTISKNQHLRNKRAAIREKDVLIYSVGVYCGLAAKAEKHLLPANIPRSVAIVRLDEKQDITPEVLAIFLNTKYGKAQTYRLRAGNAQPMLALEQINKIIFPIFSKKFQNNISRMYNDAYLARIKSKKLYDEAEELLLKELKLYGYNPKHSLTFEVNKTELEIAERFDAEFFQPKYNDMINNLKNYEFGYEYICNVLIDGIKNGTTPKEIYKIYDENKYTFVRSESFDNHLNIDDNSLYSVDKEIFEKLNYCNVQKNDVLVSMTGTIGQVAVYSFEKKGIINQNVVRLRCNHSIINPICLAIYIKTIGKELLIQHQTGNVQPYVNIPNFSKLIVPLINKKVQLEIVKKIKKSCSLRETAKRLLDINKKSIEIAIGKNEDDAEEWINQEIKNLNVAI